MPRSMDASTVRRTALVPARWPSAIGTPCMRAQRPFPSMMIAIARGASSASSCGSGASVTTRGSGARSASDLHDFGFLVLQQLVDRLRVGVGELLHLLLGTPLVVVADVAVPHELLEVTEGISAHLANGDAVLLGHV